MAKWGEGDPRWIVEERPDSTNVNNWHWTEKNCFAWAEQYLRSALKGVAATVGDAQASITAVSSVEGEVTINNRKGKVFYLYDLTLTLDWEGTNPTTAAAGKLTVNDVTPDDDDYTFEITVTDESNDKRPIREVVRTKLLGLLKTKFTEFAHDLKQEFSSKVLLPTKGASDSGSSTPASASASSVNLANSAAAAAGDAGMKKEALSRTSGKVSTGTVKIDTEFLASAEMIYDVLLDPRRVEIWTQSQAQISREINAPFALFSGNITGRVLELTPNKTLKMAWRANSWPAGHESTVTITLDQGSSSTFLHLLQVNVPLDQVDATSGNWHTHYFDRIKAIFGWGLPSTR